MLKNNQAYDSQIDEKNRENTKEKKNVHASKNLNRRYEATEQNAPISRRQSKKRKEWKQSQSDNSTMCGIGVSIPSVC